MSETAQPEAPDAAVQPEPALADPFFSTEHLQRNLGHHSVRGAMATFGGQGVSVLLGLVGTAILARLLTPEDYGLVGMVGIVVGFVALFSDAGLSMATIQQDKVSHAQVSTLFWLNVLLGCLLAVILVAISPGIAWFFGRPELAPIAAAISLTFIVGGLTPQHQALLRRQMRFGVLAVIAVASQIVGIAAGVAAACLGCGYWSLVIGTLATTVGKTVGVWVACPWIPGLPVRGAGVLRMLKFGGNLTAANLFVYFYRKFDDFLTGWQLGAGPLAIYQKAYTLLMLPMQQISGPITAVALPALSRLQTSPEQFRRYYCRGISLLAVVGMPMVVGCFCAADEIILVLLGRQWLEVTPVFRALAFAAFVDTINVAAGWTLLPFGRSDRQFICSTCGSLVCAIGFVVGMHWGILGIAISLSITILPVRTWQFLYSFRGTPIRMRDLLQSVWAPACVSVASGLGLYLVTLVCQPPEWPLASLAYKMTIGAMFYVGILFSFPAGREILRQSWNLRSHLQAQNAAADLRKA